jgi:hypothetical protein
MLYNIQNHDETVFGELSSAWISYCSNYDNRESIYNTVWCLMTLINEQLGKRTVNKWRI